MSISVIRHHSTIYKLFYFTFILSCITGVPVSVDNFYNKFIETLKNNNCKMPEEIKLPFNLSADPEPFGYLSVPLKECQTTEAFQENTEAYLLCKEVFEVLTNITCPKYKSSLPAIKSTLLHSNVCSEFQAMKDIFPTGNYYAPRLVDKLICEVFCSNKFESLCQTLIWSYDVQSQIKAALLNGVQDEKKDTKKISLNDGALETIENKNGNIDGNDIAKEDLAAGKENVNPPKKEPTHEEPNNVNDLEEQIKDKVNKNPSVNDANLENVVTVSPNFISPTPLNNGNTQNQNPGIQGKNVKSTTEKIKTPVSEKQITDAGRPSTAKINEITGVQENKNTDLKSMSKSKNVDLKHKIKDIIQLDEEHPTYTSSDQITNDLVSESSLGKDSQNKEASGSILPDIDSNKASKSVTNNNQGNMKSVNPATSNNTPDNEINNIDNQKQEDESKGKEPETTLKNPDEGDASNAGKISDNTKETDPGIPSIISSESDSKLELATPEISVDEGIPQDGEDPDAYYESNELLNGDEFSKTEPEKTLSQSPQEKVLPDGKNSVTGEIEVGIPSDGTSNSDLFMDSRNHVRDNIPMGPPFPEQEDSHFFFYFLSIVLILMAGYLIFHNKQKIIALIVEGRHERSRRRSHGAGYKKLETK